MEEIPDQMDSQNQGASTSHTECETAHSNLPFDFKKLCFICGKQYRKPGAKVKSLDVQNRILKCCELQKKSAYDQAIQRIKSVSSLADVHACYHYKCYNDCTYIPAENPIPNKRSRQIDDSLQNVYEFIEESGITEFTLNDLQPYMKDYEPSYPTLVERLVTRYGNQISYQPKIGRKPAKISYYPRGVDDIEPHQMNIIQKNKILEKAALILQEDILNEEFDILHYPAPQKFFDGIEQYPVSLNYFFDKLLITKNHEKVSKKKEKKGSLDNETTKICDKYTLQRTNIIHSVIKIIRPRSFISSLQLAIGTYVYRKCGSKLLLDILSTLGVSSSYFSVQQFEASSIINENPPEVDPDTFSQFGADNTDHTVSVNKTCQLLMKNIVNIKKH